MASSGAIALIFSVIFITAGYAEDHFVKVECSRENVGQHGQESLLNCTVKTKHEAADAQIRVVVWKKDGIEKPLLLYHKEVMTPTPGYKFADPSWKDTKNISLLITNTVVPDEGTYSCHVITDSGDNKNVTSLKVKAKYSTPKIDFIPEKLTPNADSTLTCESEGGYPQGQIRWFDKDGHEWTKSAEMEVIQADSGLYQLKSKLPLLNGDSISELTCVVFNSTGGKEEETTSKIPPPNILDSRNSGQGQSEMKEASKIVAPIVVIGSLLVGLLMVLLWRKRSRRSYEHGAGCHHEDCMQAEKMMDKECPDSPA